MSTAIEPVTDVSVAQGQSQLNAVNDDANRWETALNTKGAVHTYSCYVLILQVVNHLSLDKIDTQVIAESQMMNIEHEMQSKLIEISQFISKIQSQSTGYVAYDVVHSSGADSWSPNTFLGLKNTFYQIGDQKANWGQEIVSSDYKTSMDSFESAFKSLFYCNSDPSAPTVASLSKISNPNVFQKGQDFDLSSMWAKLQGQYSAYNRTYSTDMSGKAYASPQTFNVVSANPSDHASLIQQYMYYKAQLAVDNSSVSAVDAAKGDITKLVDFSPTGGDAFLQQTLQVITMFNSSVTVGMSPGSSEAANPWMDTTSDKVLDLILQDQRTNYTPAGVGDSGWWNSDNNTYINNGPHWANDGHGNPILSQDAKVGLYGAFSYMGFNSYWAQAATGSGAGHLAAPYLPSNDYDIANEGTYYTPDPGPWDAPEASYCNRFWGEITDAKGVSNGDILGANYSNTNSVITNLGTVTSIESTQMQQLTANEGENVNIVQNALQGMNQGAKAFSQNQISS